jgi:hypothetical protein
MWTQKPSLSCSSRSRPLSISISLNRYLLKGIAAGLAGKSATAKGGVRFSSQEKDEPKPQWEEVKPEKTNEREPEVVVYKQIEDKPQPQPQPQIVAHKPRRATIPPDVHARGCQYQAEDSPSDGGRAPAFCDTPVFGRIQCERQGPRPSNTRTSPWPIMTTRESSELAARMLLGHPAPSRYC